MVKFPRDVIEQLVMRHWRDKDTALTVYWVGIGALHWIVWNGEEFVVDGEVLGLTIDLTKDAIFEESFCLLPSKRLIQVKMMEVSLQLTSDLELAKMAHQLGSLRKVNPQYQPYDCEFEVCDVEIQHRSAIRNKPKRGKAKVPTPTTPPEGGPTV